MLVRIGCNSDRSDIMRFIFSDVNYSSPFDKLDLLAFCLLDEYGEMPYEIEDIRDNIIWLITDKKSYEEMREYYVKG